MHDTGGSIDASVPLPAPPRQDPDRPPEYSDDELALRFADCYAGELRHVAKWGKWLRYDECRWRQDETQAVVDLARRICRGKAANLDSKSKLAKDISSVKTIRAVERLAQSDRRLAATTDQWDADPWLLNTPDCVVDLRSGREQPHQADDYLTKVTAVSPGGDYPIWLAFLERITAGDSDLMDFLQRVAGYILTGLTVEHALFFAYGTGANGKSTFTDTLLSILKDYAQTAPMEVFTASSVDRHPTELAMLHGARLVTSQETDQGRRWAESRIKSLTGGDPITARFMRQDYFTFTPRFKLLIAGNHKPGLRGVDEAMRRRFHLIPFAVTIPEDERDQKLADKLKEEWPGILSWAIEGCRHWQRLGLQAPSVVRDATAQYLEGEDSVSAWLDACCRLDPQSWESSTDLFESWRHWCNQTNEYVGSQRRFIRALETHGFVPLRKNTGRGMTGLAIVRPEGAA